MRTFRNGALALVAVAVWAAPARPDEKAVMVPEEGAVQVMLLRQKCVRDDLKLTDAEAKQIHEHNARQWKKAQEVDKLSPEERQNGFRDLTRENEQFLDRVLRPEQRERLDEITLQVAGLLAVTNPKVAQKLNLTEDQKRRAKDLQLQARQEMQDLIRSKSAGQRADEFRALRETSRKRLMEVLTDEQEAKWKQMTGQKFTGTLKFDPDDEG